MTLIDRTTESVYTDFIFILHMPWNGGKDRAVSVTGKQNLYNIPQKAEKYSILLRPVLYTFFFACGSRFPQAFGRKSFVTADFLRKWAEKVCGERFPEEMSRKSFVAADFLRK